MHKNYEKPKVTIMAWRDDVIRTSDYGIKAFNSNWLERNDGDTADNFQEN